MWIKLHDRKKPNDHTLAAFTGTRRRYERKDRPGTAPSHAGRLSRASIKADAKKAEQWFDERFFFSESGPRWQEQIQSAFFYAEEIQNFSPSPGERYITGQDLRKRWAALENSSVCPGTVDEFIRGMIKNDRLWDIHPITGGTKWDDDGTNFGKNRVKDLPSKDEALFPMEYVLAIEREEPGLAELLCAGTGTAASALPKQTLQEKRLNVIVAKLKEAGHSQNAIPKNMNGKSGAKAACLLAIKGDKVAAALFGKNIDSTFDKAWAAGFKHVERQRIEAVEQVDTGAGRQIAQGIGVEVVRQDRAL